MLIALLALGTLACNRWEHEYPEDGVRTKDTPMERLTGKWWELERVEFKGKDITDSVRNRIGVYRMFFTNTPADNTSDLFLGTIYSDTLGNSSVVWNFFEENKSLSMIRENSTSSLNHLLPIPCYHGWTWGFQIMKLAESQLKISCNYDSSYYYTNTFRAN